MDAVFGIRETRFNVGDPGEVESHDKVGDDDVDLGEGADAAFALEGFVAEVGAVGEVEDRVWV